MTMMRLEPRAVPGQLALVLAFGLALCARAHADPPATAAAEPAKPVRQVGGEHGPKVEAQAEPDAVPGRDAMRRAREQLHERLDEARAHMKEARDQMQEAREQVKSAVDKAPDEARVAMEKARAEGREAVQQARDAMKDARESLKQALPGMAGPKDRAERARYARRMAWHAMMHRVHRPSDIPPAMREELRHHARRMARLARIRAIASDKKDEAVTKRCDALITREQARHQAKMAQLDKALPPPAPRPAANTPEDDEDPAEPEPAEDKEDQEEP
jgi:hypothetical protein